MTKDPRSFQLLKRETAYVLYMIVRSTTLSQRVPKVGSFQIKYVHGLHRDYEIAALLTSSAAEKLFDVSACLFMGYLRLSHSGSESTAGISEQL